jgi:hypothetical protein
VRLYGLDSQSCCHLEALVYGGRLTGSDFGKGSFTTGTACRCSKSIVVHKVVRTCPVLTFMKHVLLCSVHNDLSRYTSSEVQLFTINDRLLCFFMIINDILKKVKLN